MPSLTHHTDSVSSDQATRQWLVVDAADQTLGRLATRVANVLRGKHKPSFTPNTDQGDFVVVINASKIHLTGNKMQQKKWHRHSGSPGGLKSTSYEDLIARRPEWVIEKAVKGMLPKSSLGRNTLKKLKVYAGNEHPHQAQKPVPMGQTP